MLHHETMQFTHEEFLGRLNSYQASNRRFAAGIMAYLVVYSVALVGSAWACDIKSRSAAFTIPYCIVLAGLLFGPIFYADHRSAKLQKRLGLVCGRCHKPLAKTSGSSLLHTGQCENCHTQVVKM
jgi:hypothetical protein